MKAVFVIEDVTSLAFTTTLSDPAKLVTAGRSVILSAMKGKEEMVVDIMLVNRYYVAGFSHEDVPIFAHEQESIETRSGSWRNDYFGFGACMARGWTEHRHDARPESS